ncbi:MAG: hypothetical protein D6737_13125 [Chloroflexi bacterium]|nr:MAG: hypothetical protein CUN54_06255 [Phototrophicales bacterium]RMF78942.1 MAG: hypothetical protein D6737_13125 [Chloroflexota bacterium]
MSSTTDIESIEPETLAAENEDPSAKPLPIPNPGYIQVGVWIVAGIIFGGITYLSEPIEVSILVGIISGLISGSVVRAAAESINKFSQE